MLERNRATSGNISAHAEKTRTSWPDTQSWRKHLCTRRENLMAEDEERGGRETSLHTQRKRKAADRDRRHDGNISAHAEKTCGHGGVLDRSEKHLCTRRENFPVEKCWSYELETSLHTQRKQQHLALMKIHHATYRAQNTIILR